MHPARSTPVGHHQFPPYQPAPPRRSGRGLLVVLVVALLLVCGGVPGVAALRYLTLENGPYQTLPPPCAVFNTEGGKALTRGLAGQPRPDRTSPHCAWSAPETFLLQLTIRLYHRDFLGSTGLFADSIEVASHFFVEAKRLARTFASPDSLPIEDSPTYVQKDAAGIGDEAFLEFKGTPRALVLSVTARTGNVIVEIHHLQTVTQRQPDYAAAEQALRDFEDTAAQWYADVAEELR